MTDRETDMRNHMHNLHAADVQDKILRNEYVKDKARLDLKSSWSIKDIERNYKTFPEIYCGNQYELLI